MNEKEDARRQFLIRVLAAGLFVAAPFGLRSARADLLGKLPGLSEGKSIYRLKGAAKINGAPATADSRIGPNDIVETQEKSELVFVVGKDAFILRSNSRLELAGSNILVQTLRLITGGLLSVFGKTSHRITTPIATLGIRGTGIYVESEADSSYICTCYGETELTAVNDAASRESIVSRHHDAPRYVLAKGQSGNFIQKAPFKNHTDEELALIEALVGRSPPFQFPPELTSGGYY